MTTSATSQTSNSTEANAANRDFAGALLGVYKSYAPVFVRGEGALLYDENERAYLDFLGGIAVNSLGYGDAAVAEAIRGALEAGVIHTSNLLRTRPAAALAQWLVDHSFADRVFFCNSGAEANEGAFKFARRWARAQGSDEKVEIVAFHNGFHGRTFGALSATARPEIQDSFRPLVPGVRFCAVGDEAAADELIRGRRTAAVIIEPLQAEGGVRPVDPAFLRKLRYLCDQEDALLIFDEVQVGLGRTGTLWAYEQLGVVPDLMTLAKPLAGGLPMGAVLLTDRVASALRPGDHASTFGGGVLVASAALAVCQRIGEPAFLAEVRRKASVVADRLGGLALASDRVASVRGAGLIWGIELQGVPAADVVARALELGLLVCSAGPDVVRLLPPLTITDDELDRGFDLLEEAIRC